MKLISWNANNRTHVVEQAKALGKEECSWKTRRYDHVFASRALCPQSAEYLQDFRELHLSDHVPIEVLFESMSLVKE